MQEETVITWLKDNWRWAALNVLALAVMANLLRQTDKLGNFNSNFEPLIESGKWAVRFLLVSLAMTPLNTLLGWRSAIKLRKPAGLWAFGFGLLHFTFYVADIGGQAWLLDPIPVYYMGLGVIGLLILSAMAVTSNRWAMKRMGKSWKRLHRLVYAAGIIVIVHGLFEAAFSKRALITDSQVTYEVQLYLAILVILLGVRIPAVRSALANLRHRRRTIGGAPGQASSAM
jgi:sulfoxide reductase heme-binding subunit YedZ